MATRRMSPVSQTSMVNVGIGNHRIRSLIESTSGL